MPKDEYKIVNKADRTAVGQHERRTTHQQSINEIKNIQTLNEFKNKCKMYVNQRFEHC